MIPAASLSYLRGGRGAYGYLINAIAEHETLQRIASNSSNGCLRLSCELPPNVPQGGLTIYGAECGRFPLCPTIVVEQ
jgi:hypothetical protein